MEFCFLGLNWPLTSNMKIATHMGWFCNTFINTKFELNVTSQTTIFRGLLSKNQVFWDFLASSGCLWVPLFKLYSKNDVQSLVLWHSWVAGCDQLIIGLYNFSTLTKIWFNLENWYIWHKFLTLLLHISIEEISADILSYRTYIWH